MKRYFYNNGENQVVEIECSQNSVLVKQDIQNLFGDQSQIVEVNKSEYVRLREHCRRTNETNLTMTITR